MKNLKYVLIISFILLLFPLRAEATLGVGIGTGKIVVEDELKPGAIYVLPPITVLNTGDEVSEYTLNISYHEKQPELWPDREWFKFSPKKFTLKPGEVQIVEVRLDLPVKTVPGDYFAYVEASPVKSSSGENGATVGIAAATKLYFTIVPTNLVMGVYHKIVSLWQYYQPWSTRVSLLLLSVVIVYIGSRFLNIDIKIKKNKKNEDKI